MSTLTELHAEACRRWQRRRSHLLEVGNPNIDSEAPCPAVVAWNSHLRMYWRLRRQAQRAVRQWAAAGIHGAAENNRADLARCNRTIRETILPNLRAAYDAERQRQRPLMAAE